MGNCESCVSGRERRSSWSSDDDIPVPVQKASAVPAVNEIQYASGGGSNMVNHRILPFDRRPPSIKIPDPVAEKPPRKHRGI